MKRWERIERDAMRKAGEISDCSLPRAERIALELVCQYAERLEDALGGVVDSPWTVQSVKPWPITWEDQREIDYERECSISGKDVA